MIDNSGVNARTADAIGPRANDLAARNYRDIRRSTADIDNCRSTRIVWSYTTPESRRQTFLDHSHAADVCVLSGRQQRTPFYRSYIRQHAHQRSPAEVR